MTEQKVRLSISVPGAQMMSEQECSKNPKDNYQTEIVNITSLGKKGKLHKESLTIHTRKCKTAKQVIAISREAYEFMINPDVPPTAKLAKKTSIPKIIGKLPDGKPKKVLVPTTVWASYTLKQRLNWHMAKIAEDMRGVSYSFEILED